MTYQTPAPQYTPTVPTSGLATTSMVFGIFGAIFSLFFFPSVIAILTGHEAKKWIKRGERVGNGMATTGLVTGYVGLALFFGFMFFVVIPAAF